MIMEMLSRAFKEFKAHLEDKIAKIIDFPIYKAEEEDKLKFPILEDQI